MTITSAAELKFLPHLLQSSLRNVSLPSGAGNMDLAVSFAFRRSYRRVRR
ncbi:MAG TPA: hypothetical protein VNY53_10150 [Bradyrhizobium sp.]|jgi:hypothetical protein|nr:hypothetical protein [Bradyrhizobium sp.]